MGVSVSNLAGAILAFRRVRAESLPSELFGEPAWDLLLELFVADADGVRLTGWEVSQRCGIPPALLSRWLLHLSKTGLVVGDGEGDLSDSLTLSGKGMAAMEQVMSMAGQVQLVLGSDVPR